MSRTSGLLLMLLGACSAGPAADSNAGIVSRVLTFESRAADVPATFVRPRIEPGVHFPIVVMAHGHGGTRDEAGGFRRLAEALARRGIASIRMDFPGCGDSREPFLRNNLSTMVADLQAALAFARAQPGIDPEQTAVVGYSMGARVAMLGLRDDYDAVVLWPPAGSDGPGAIFDFIGGRDHYLNHRERAISTGSTLFVTPWGHEQLLVRCWFDEMDSSRPLDSIRGFSGALLVVHGADDAIISPEITSTVAGAASASARAIIEIVDGADHGLGFYTDGQLVSDRVINTTVDFLIRFLY